MSVVENQNESTKAEAPANSKEITEDSLHSGTSLEESSVKTAEEAPVSPGHQPSGGEAEEAVAEGDVVDVKKPAASPVRAWFEKLDAMERASAFGFVDGPFLTTLLANASWSPETFAALKTPSVGKSIDWSTMVQIRDFEAALSSSEGGGDTSAKSEAEAEPTEGEASAIDEDASGKDAGDVAVAKAQVESNALRIRTEIELSVKVDSPPNPSPSVKDIDDSLLRHLSVTFPSAFRHVSEDQVYEPYPFLTIKPSYLETTPNEELFLALDSLARASFDREFLARDGRTDNARRAASWLEQSLGEKFSPNTSLPLSGVLVARLEAAVVDFFMDSRSKRPLELTSSEHSKSFSSGTDNYTSCNETEPTAEEKVLPAESSTVRPRARSLVTDLAAHARSLNDNNTAVDAAALEPMFDAFGIGRPKSFQLDSLLFTPLEWCAPDEKSRVDVSVLDGGIQSALLRLKEDSSAKLAAADPTKVAPPVGEKNKGMPAVGQDQKATHQKKKRRKSRKKKKKAPSADKHGAVAATAKESSPRPEPEESSKKDKVTVKPPPPPPVFAPKEAVEESPSRSTTAKAETATPADEAEVAAIGDVQSVDSSDSSEGDLVASQKKGGPLKRGDVTISRHKGVLAVAPSVTKQAPSPATVVLSQKDSSGDIPKQVPQEEDDGDTWETVEVKVRGNRKKGSNQPSSRQGAFGNSNDPHHGSGGKKTKMARTSATRKRAIVRKMAKDIVSSVLDRVDEEVRRKKPIATRPAVNPWKVAPPVSKGPANQVKEAEKVTKEPPVPAGKTMRDVVMKGLGASTPKRVTPQGRFFPESKRTPPSNKDKISRSSRASPTHRGRSAVGNDQNTAPTSQETVSAVSTPSNAAVDSKEERTSSEERVSKRDSSSNSTNEAPQNEGRAMASHTKDGVSGDPPLPTLLSPENGNSATSSVASSLEVPHGSHRHHHSNSPDDVNDVGYHLLDVCDRLSSDMSLFMSRRQLALTARRRERGALLAALQDTLSSIWPNGGRVEMYGSCATQLDLPSSDVDVVVVGIDGDGDTAEPQSKANAKASGDSKKADESQRAQRVAPVTPYVPYPMHVNGERVLRLAAELEAQPWAVQVKAIPKATVPVVKVLADPSRLSGAANGGDWMDHHQHLASQVAAAAGKNALGQSEGKEGAPQQYRQSGLLPWRGSDVMNGLLSLDITFEGPEHGGIGSTEFSANVVAEACQEFGLPPDATPIVQVVMVVKELLVQRKLNEPYSGGLSSYALLLLVLALLRERAVIKEEIERVERQRRAMAAGDTDGAFNDAGKPSKQDAEPGAKKSLSVVIPEPNSTKTKPDSTQTEKKPLSPHGTNANSTNSTPTVATKAKSPKRLSSWASVAKNKSGASTSSNASQETVSKAAGQAKGYQKKATATKKPSFADAVARSTGASGSPARKKGLQNKSANRGPNAGENASTKGDSVRSARTDPTSQHASEAKQRRKTDSAVSEPVSLPQPTPSVDSQLMQTPTFFAQGLNDIVEVLCSGETTAGKLLMHFLLFYGEYFDAQSAAIDISGKHERGYNHHMSPYPYMSPYIPRRSHGNIDPVTGMLTVDPIIIYDPLEGAENNNVARRCFAWNSVRWIFAQSYATLSSAVERSATPPASSGGRNTDKNRDPPAQNATGSCTSASDVGDDLMDPSSPLLRCLLSF